MVDDVLINLRNLLNAQFSASFNRIIIGHIDKGMISDLPAMAVYPITSVTAQSGTVKDEIDFECGVDVLANARQFYKNTTAYYTPTQSTVSAELQLTRWIEDLQANGDYATASVKGIIRRNLTLNNATLYNNEVTSEYGMLEATEEPVCKATVRFRAYKRQNRN